MTDLEAATASYEAGLNARTLDYLSARGISADAARAFRLGLVTEPAVGHDRFHGYLAIPYVTRAGVRGLKFRCLQDHVCSDLGHGKYDKPAGMRNRIYNPSALLTHAETVAVCEGELDAIVCTTVVGVPAVGVPGVGSWKEHLPRCFAGFERVLVFVDSDPPKVRENCHQCRDGCRGHSPGLELGERIAADLEQAVVVTPPKGSDLTEWVLAEGPDAVRQACGLEVVEERIAS